MIKRKNLEYEMRRLTKGIAGIRRGFIAEKGLREDERGLNCGWEKF